MPNLYNKTKPYPKDAIYIGRPSKWGNPFTHHADKDTLAEHVVGSRKEAINAYRNMVLSNPDLCNEIRNELRGKDLVCWCYPKPCHGDILISIANQSCLGFEYE